MPLRFADPHPFSCGLAQVVVDDRIGFVDHKGKFVVAPNYLYASDFHEGRAWVGFEVHELELGPTRYAYIDTTGKMITRPEFSTASDFSEGLAAVRMHTKQGNFTGYIGLDGKWAIKPQFDSASDFHEGMAAVTLREKVGYIDRTGRIVVKPRFEEGADFHCGLACVMYGGKYGYIARHGAMRIAPRFHETTDFSEGLARVRDARTLKWGYIDTKGNVKIAPRYDVGTSFHEGLAFVQSGNKCGYINNEGTMLMLTPAQGHTEWNGEAWGFSEKLAPFVVSLCVGAKSAPMHGKSAIGLGAAIGRSPPNVVCTIADRKPP